MGGGRAKAATACCALLMLGAAGCGAQEHKSQPRPQPPTRVSVSITGDAISVQPSRVALGPEPTQQIPQNEKDAQPQVRSNAPLSVVFVTANLTGRDAKLLLRGPRDVTSAKLFANSNGTLAASLPTGTYTIRAAGLPGAAAGRLTVGPYRTSSENDVLLP